MVLSLLSLVLSLNFITSSSATPLGAGILANVLPVPLPTCAAITQGLALVNQGPSATAFCSSYLSISTKTFTVTRTVSATSATPATTTASTQTLTVSTETDVTSTTTTTTSTSTASIGTTTIFTATTTSTVFTGPTSTFTSYAAPAAMQKRALPTIPLPGYLSAFLPGAQLSQACSCLSITPASTTLTPVVTSTTTQVIVSSVTSTEFDTSTTLTTTVLISTIPATTTVVTSTTPITTTVTTTTTQATTFTSTLVLPQPTAFKLQCIDASVNSTSFNGTFASVRNNGFGTLSSFDRFTEPQADTFNFTSAGNLQVAIGAYVGASAIQNFNAKNFDTLFFAGPGYSQPRPVCMVAAPDGQQAMLQCINEAVFTNFFIDSAGSWKLGAPGQYDGTPPIQGYVYPM